MDSITMVDGKTYKVAHVFSDTRVIIDWDLGAFVLADKAPDGTWDLSGVPATPDEEVVVKQLNAPTNDTTVTTVVKDD
jgi:hypothetical protein